MTFFFDMMYGFTAPGMFHRQLFGDIFMLEKACLLRAQEATLVASVENDLNDSYSMIVIINGKKSSIQYCETKTVDRLTKV